MIIVRAGTGSLHRSWVDPQIPRTWDLFVCPYEDIPRPPKEANGWLSSDIIAGPKFTGLRVLLQEWQGWRDYRYVVLADDDFLQFLLHHTAVIAELLENVAKAARLGGSWSGTSGARSARRSGDGWFKGHEQVSSEG